MESTKDTNLSEIYEKVEIFSNDDERLQSIGEILSNTSSRGILKLLISNELTAHEIVQKTNLSLSLVLHHLNKMQTTGIVKISKITQTSKNQDMKHYMAKAGIMIFPPIVSEKAKTSKTLQNSLKRIMRFCSIGIAGVTSWFAIRASQPSTESMLPLPPELASQLLLASLFWPVAVSLTVVIIGLIIERIFAAFRK
ncbi:MAG: ArsR family transcriptional regulator [Nitrosopumilaceae archaeon]